MRALLLTVLAGCGRIAFDVVDQAASDAPAGDAPQTDGAPSDGPTVRACHTDSRYETAPGLVNTYREGAPLVSFAQARADCKLDDADLWVVESLTEQLAFTGDWTGITDEATENMWLKLDGTPATYLPFLALEPDGGTAENCIRTDTSGFEDRECGDLRDYVCECPAP